MNLEQLLDPHFQRRRERFENLKSRVRAAVLDPADDALLDANLGGQDVLRPPFFLPEPPDVRSQSFGGYRVPRWKSLFESRPSHGGTVGQ
nr:hypothetical protein [Bradyrhizobium sp. AUGA SZCCT0176]